MVKVRAAIGVAVFFVLGTARAQSVAIVEVEDFTASPTTLTLSDPVAISGFRQNGADTDYQSGATAAGAADLTTGTLRILSSGTLLFMTGVPDAPLPLATATIDDDITIHGPGPTVSIQGAIAVDGTLVISPVTYAPARATSSTLDLAASCSIGGTGKGMHIVRTYTTYADGGVSDTTSVSPSSDPAITGTLPGAITATVQVDVAVEQPVHVSCSLLATSDLYKGLSSDPNGFGGSMDYGNTARFSLTLPPGYTFTSASGVLLSNPGGQGMLLDGGSAPSDGGGDGSSGSVDASGPTGDGGTSDASGSTGHGGTAGSGCSASGATGSNLVGLLVSAVAVAAALRRRRPR